MGLSLFSLLFFFFFILNSSLKSSKMINDEGKNVDLYIPRKCSATNRLIAPGDHASVQINIGHVDANGIYNGNFSTFAFGGFIRNHGEADEAFNRLVNDSGLMNDLHKQ